MNKQDLSPENDLRRSMSYESELMYTVDANPAIPASTSRIEILLDGLTHRCHEAMSDLSLIQQDIAGFKMLTDYASLRESVVSGDIANAINTITECFHMVDGIAGELAYKLRKAIRFTQAQQQLTRKVREENEASFAATSERLAQKEQAVYALQDGYVALWNEVGDNLATPDKVIYPELLATMLARWQFATELAEPERPTIVETRYIGQLISFLSALKTHHSAIKSLQEEARLVQDSEKARAVNDDVAD